MKAVKTFMTPWNAFFPPLSHRSLIIFYNLKQCTVISRPPVLTCLSTPDTVKSSPPPFFAPAYPERWKTKTEKKRKEEKRKENSWRLNNGGKRSSSAKFGTKIDVVRGTLLKLQAEIAIQSDYPCPLTAADSMSQSGMCIINQWLLFAPSPLSPPSTLPRGSSQCKTGWRTIPSSVTKCTAQSLQDDVSPAID